MPTTKEAVVIPSDPWNDGEAVVILPKNEMTTLKLKNYPTNSATVGRPQYPSGQVIISSVAPAGNWASLPVIESWTMEETISFGSPPTPNGVVLIFK